MNTRQLASIVLLTLSATAVAASDKASQEAAARYAEDKKLCAEETSSSARMQCLRDAKAEYNQALKTSASSKSVAPAPAVPSSPYAPPPAARAPAICSECGRVVAVKIVEQKGEGSPLGMIAGGVAGAVLGHQVGAGRGKDVATIAGAAGGAYAGNKIEEHMKTSKSWKVAVRFDDGTEREYHFSSDPGYAAGDQVRQSGSSIVRH